MYWENVKYLENVMNIHVYLYLWITIFKHVLTIAYPVFQMQKKRIKMNIVFCHFLYHYQLKKIRSTWKKCIEAIAMNNYIQTRHKYCISSFSDSKKVKMSMKFFHFLCHYLLEGGKIKYLEKCIKPMCHENICMLYVNTFIHTHSVV